MNEKTHLLYEPFSRTPIVCKIDNWRECPDHSHLSDVPPSPASLREIGLDEGTLEDDPNDDIVSPREYSISVGLLQSPEDVEAYEESLRSEDSTVTDHELNKKGKRFDAIGKTLATLGGAGGVTAGALTGIGLLGGVLIAVPLMAGGLWLSSYGEKLRYRSGASLSMKSAEWKAREDKRRTKKR